MQSDFHLMPTELKDIEELALVHLKCLHESYTGLIDQDFLNSLQVHQIAERWKSNLLNPSSQTLRLTLRHHQNLIGFCGSGPARNPLPGSAAEIYAIYLLKQYQGQGLGLCMMQSMLQFILEQNWFEAHIWVLKGNQTCQFYEQIGAYQINCTQHIKLGSKSYEELCYHLDYNALRDLTEHFPCVY